MGDVWGPPPARTGRYQLRGVLGRGGFATVYRAFDPALDSEVAVKLLAPAWADDPEVRERFVREARIMRRLGSEHVVTVHDIDESADGRPFIVMALATRGTLHQRLADATRAGPGLMGWPDLRAVIEGMARGLEDVHGGGVVHRDLKPSNLLLADGPRGSAGFAGQEVLRPDDRILLGDFGLARDAASLRSGLATVAGTPEFMAPEQTRPDGRVDPRADVYSASAVVVYLATGQHLAWAARVQDPSLAGAEAVGLPRELFVVLEEGLRIDPAARPSSISEWRDALIGAVAGHAGTWPAAPTPLTPPPWAAGAPPGAPGAPTSVAPTSPVPIDPAPTIPHGAASATPPPTPPPNPSAPPPASTSARPGRRRRWLLAPALVVVVIALAVAAGTLVLRATTPSIDAPDEIAAGETVAVALDGGGDATWRLPDGSSVDGDTAEFVADVVGTVTVAAEVDGALGARTVEHEIVVTTSDLSPTVIGPSRVRVGEDARFEADVADDAIVTWTDPSGATIDAPILVLTPTSSGRLEFSATATYPDGLAITTPHVVTAEDR